MGERLGGSALPPGPASPGPWQLLRCQLDFAGYLDACVARHGPLFTLRMPPFEAFVAATDPADVERVLTGTTTRFEEGAASAILEPLVGRSSLILSTGPQHMRQRRALLPAFHGSLGERWEQPIAEIAERELARLPLGRPVALREPMRRIALDVICRVLFGGGDPAAYAALRDEVARGLDPRIVVLLWFPTLWRRHGRLNPARPHQRRRAYIHGLVHELIAARRAEIGSGSGPAAERDDVLSRLVTARDEDGELLADGEVRDQLLALLMAGHETTANSLTWAFERLSRTPRAERRLAAEVADTDADGENGGGGTAYLDAVVSETLRTRPSVIDAVRTATSELELSGGYALPPGTVVSAMLTAMHRRADLWEDPLAFRPERFLDGRPPPYSYAPFGGGIRHCIGASLSLVELRTVLRTAIRTFEVVAAPGPEERMRLTGITLTPSRGGQVILRRRRSAA